MHNIFEQTAVAVVKQELHSPVRAMQVEVYLLCLEENLQHMVC